MNWEALILGICLALITWQDAKFRQVHISLLIIMFLVSFYNSYLQLGNLSIKISGFNILFFFLTFGLMVAYISIKNNSFNNPFTHYFGLGDVLFYVAVSPLFVNRYYVLFFICSLLFSMLLHAVFKKVSKHNTVPLAGYAAFLLLLIISCDVLTDSKITTIFL
ncbi:hypothetical protein [Flavobacterium rhizosphaerae]|uniref:Prepilin type IV endopeptidase peptidase domain-containing protein n=1 Tax=Flavobacterium rhizosphaerae TaxID=3163298 RepID=A0ABW8YW12_9FLAO